MKSLTLLANSRFNILLTTCIALSQMSCGDVRSDNYKEMIAGQHGQYWDIVFNEGKYRKDPNFGYFFRPDGKFYSYHYYGEGRTPFNDQLYDYVGEESIEANLRSWDLLSDTAIVFRDKIYKIQSISHDTIVLNRGVAKNPILKLAKSN